MATSFLVNARHRTRALAERHRDQLASRYEAKVTIVARQNARGQFSGNGQFWTFKVKRRQVEYVIHFDYKTKKGHAVDVQVHIMGPANALDDDAVDAAVAFMKDKRIPTGWKVKVIGWRNGEQETTPGKMRDAADRLHFAVYGKSTVTRRRRRK